MARKLSSKVHFPFYFSFTFNGPTADILKFTEINKNTFHDDAYCPLQWRGGECLPRGVSAKGGPGDVWSGGVSVWGCLPRGCTDADSPIACWDTPPAHCMMGYTTPLLTEGMTHACENITFPATTVANGNNAGENL